MGSNAAVAKYLHEPETTTHKYLSKSNAYKKQQHLKGHTSKWRKGELRNGARSKLFDTERQFMGTIVHVIKSHGGICERETKVPGETGRRIDCAASYDGADYAIEGKITNRTSRVDQCLGQVILKAKALDMMPVCAFPSDAMPDRVFVHTAAVLGIKLINEKTVLDVLQEGRRE